MNINIETKPFINRIAEILYNKTIEFGFEEYTTSANISKAKLSLKQAKFKEACMILTDHKAQKKQWKVHQDPKLLL